MSPHLEIQCHPQSRKLCLYYGLCNDGFLTIIRAVITSQYYVRNYSKMFPSGYKSPPQWLSKLLFASIILTKKMSICVNKVHYRNVLPSDPNRYE